MPGPTAGAFAVFIVAALLAFISGATVFVCDERAHGVIALFCIAFMPVFLIAGIVLSNILFLAEFNKSTSQAAAFASNSGVTIFISMPGRSVAAAGLSLTLASIIGLCYSQRNNPRASCNLSLCWPDKPSAPPPAPAAALFQPSFEPTTKNPIFAGVK